MGILPFLHFAILLLTLIMTGYILYRNHRSVINRLVSAIFFFIGFWNFTHIFLHNPLVNHETALFYLGLSSIGFTPFIGIYVLFTSHLTGNQKLANSKLILALVIVIPLFFVYNQFVNQSFFTDIQLVKYGWRIYWNRTVISFLFYGYLIFCTIFSSLQLISFYKVTNDEIRKKQVIVILLTSIPPIVYGFITDIIFPNLNIFRNIPETGNISVIVWVTGLLYATKRYRLFVFSPATAAENIIEIMSDALFMIKRNGTIFYTNSSASNLTMIDSRSIINKPFPSFFSDRTKKPLNSLLQNDNIHIIEGELVTSHGKKVPVTISCSTIKENTVEVLGHVCLVRDITEQKKNEEKLEMMVKDRTADLMAAKKKAEQADMLKSAFLANMSHEIRTPMNAIIGFSDFLRESDIPEQEREVCIRQIQNNGQLLLTLIDDILDLARIESGQVSISKEPVIMNQFINEVFITFNETLLEKKQVKLIYDIPKNTEGLVIHTDPIRLKQVFNNLLRNAIKFTSSGHIKFGYTCKKKKELLFYVEDTGIGISENQITNIFERFYKIEEKNQAKLYSGTGLGLAISKQLVNLLGGDIWVKSKPKKGSTFYFTIPRNEIDINIGTKSNEILKKDTTTKKKRKLNSKTVLIVEDDEASASLLERHLNIMKLKYVRAKDGEQAIKLFYSNDGIDIILMDLKLPKMDGFDAYRKIREINKAIPIIAQTAFAGDYEIKKCKEFGFDDIIIKPIDFETLYQLFEKFNENKSLT